MRLASVRAIDGAQSSGVTKDVPEEGSYLRAIYDFLLRNRGREVLCEGPPYPSQKFAPLQDFYGLDIKRIAWRRYILVGEWLGSTYIDYTATPSTDDCPRRWSEYAAMLIPKRAAA